ncbi:MAG: hypothetical protein J6X06_05985 [Elusimicrobiaceae bacterium]|nr:hypothetical protein [Elusimicrobiaceae bacterium]
MTQEPSIRERMLNTLYNMLPSIDNDYAAKLVYTLEDKKTIAQLQQDIADLAAQLSSDSPMTDTLIAKMLLDECTLAAALKQLRVYNNSTSITELAAALNLPATDTSKLLEVYASFSSRQYFDEAFEEAFKQQAAQQTNHSDKEQVQAAVNILLEQATQLEEKDAQVISQNRSDIFTLADQYHLPVVLTAQLEVLYSQPASVLIKPEFEKLYQELFTQHTNEHLCACLTARTLLCQITSKDAQDIAQTSKLLNDELLEEDLMIIACRYLKVKTPQDIANTFDGVLQKLPYADNPQENLGLAVRVLLDGTPESFDRALRQAALTRDRNLLFKQLCGQPLYAGFEIELAQHFGGKKNYEQLNHEMHTLLQTLAYCSSPDENKELACKVLLGTLPIPQAQDQAAYLRDVAANTLTQDLAANVIKNYRGTQSPKQLARFFTSRLAPYKFWKSNRDKHIFALRSLVEELNGTYNQTVSTWVLDRLEHGADIEELGALLERINQQKMDDISLQALLTENSLKKSAEKFL